MTSTLLNTADGPRRFYLRLTLKSVMKYILITEALMHKDSSPYDDDIDFAKCARYYGVSKEEIIRHIEDLKAQQDGFRYEALKLKYRLYETIELSGKALNGRVVLAALVEVTLSTVVGLCGREEAGRVWMQIFEQGVGKHPYDA